MVTLKDLSERTGYSLATISRILNGDYTLSVSDETRRRVLEEAGRLNYSTNRSHRGRPLKSTLKVGLAEMLSPVEQLEDPYYLYLASYVKQGCLDRNYTVIPVENRGETFTLPAGAEVDGIIAVGIFTVTQIESLAAINKNIVFVDASPFESRFDAVILNYELGISLALEHLMDFGHENIGFAGPYYKYDNHRQKAPEVRRQIFIRLMKKYGIFRKEFLLDCPMDIRDGEDAMRRFAEENTDLPTAWICANEELAIGAQRALQGLGYSVPGDISVVSYNDTPRSALADPPLTSISTHVEEMALTAIRLLAERTVPTDGRPPRTLPLKVIVPPSITVRESSGPVK